MGKDSVLLLPLSSWVAPWLPPPFHLSPSYPPPPCLCPNPNGGVPCPRAWLQPPPPSRPAASPADSCGTLQLQPVALGSPGHPSPHDRSCLGVSD